VLTEKQTTNRPLNLEKIDDNCLCHCVTELAPFADKF